MSFYGPVRVLVVLDQPSLVEIVKKALNHAVYAVTAACEEVAVAVHQWQPQLVILDMDRKDGQVIAGFATRSVGKIRLPVIGLTRRGDLEFKLAAFEAGADDILTIPFAPEELTARARRAAALVRRPGQLHPGPQGR